MHKRKGNLTEERRQKLEKRKDIFIDMLLIAAFILFLDLVYCVVVGDMPAHALAVGIVSYTVSLSLFCEIEAIKDDLRK